MSLSSAELAELAEHIARRLSGAVVPATIPAYMGAEIRRHTTGGGIMQRTLIPLLGPYCLYAEWQLCPDGTIHQKLQDWQGHTFWQGVFQPVDGHQGADDGVRYT